MVTIIHFETPWTVELINDMEAVIFLSSVTFVIAVGAAIKQGYNWSPLQYRVRHWFHLQHSPLQTIPSPPTCHIKRHDSSAECGPGEIRYSRKHTRSAAAETASPFTIGEQKFKMARIYWPTKSTIANNGGPFCVISHSWGSRDRDCSSLPVFAFAAPQSSSHIYGPSCTSHNTTTSHFSYPAWGTNCSSWLTKQGLLQLKALMWSAHIHLRG